MYVYIAKWKELSRRKKLCPIYLEDDKQCLTHRLSTHELIISAQLPLKSKNGPEPAQQQTKGMMSFLHV